MSFLLLTYSIFNLTVYPANPFFEHYEIIPQLGKVSSIATSPCYTFALVDNNLLIFDKLKLKLEKTVGFDQCFNLLGYDPQYDDIWLCNPNVVRFNAKTYSIKEYQFSQYIKRFSITNDYLYLDTEQKFSLNKRSGEIKAINTFPEGLSWYKKLIPAELKNYPFLNPYYYLDDPQQSQQPLREFLITAIYDDGLEVWVGTDGYGILKYNKVSWHKERLVYGPIDRRIKRIKRFKDKIYLLSPSGISYYELPRKDWHYLRFRTAPSDVIWMNNNLIISLHSTLAQIEECMIFPIKNFKDRVISLTSDDKYIYIGTHSGLYKIIQGTDTAIQFGPNKYPIYCIYPSSEAVYVGDEFAFYIYDKLKYQWSKEINHGVKEIVQIKENLYLLGLDNQLIQYNLDAVNPWIILPYFNIYDIATDGEVLYCAYYLGIYYYEPAKKLFKGIYNLPRIQYNYVFVANDDILAISNKNIYRLPIKYRD